MNDLFEKNGFLVIKNFISKERSKKLSKEFIEFCDKNPFECNLDLQVPNSPAKSNYISFLEILCEKTPVISKIVGQYVLPTYCYSRVYKEGDSLERHTDRNSCEISLSIHLDGDQKWDFFLETLENEEKSIILNCGEAVIYYGCSVPHWRNVYSGKYYSQLFLHYVKSRGEKKKYYFDRIR